MPKLQSQRDTRSAASRSESSSLHSCARSWISRPVRCRRLWRNRGRTCVGRSTRCICFPFWRGTMPALFKGFLEHIFRPGFAMEYKKEGFPKRLLAGRSGRIVVTMGMPVLLYRRYFGAYGFRAFERSMLSFAGIKPVRESLYGLSFADDKKRARWI